MYIYISLSLHPHPIGPAKLKASRCIYIERDKHVYCGKTEALNHLTNQPASHYVHARFQLKPQLETGFYYTILVGGFNHLEKY